MNGQDPLSGPWPFCLLLLKQRHKIFRPMLNSVDEFLPLPSVYDLKSSLGAVTIIFSTHEAESPSFWYNV